VPVLHELLSRHYRPSGHRLGIMVSAGCSEVDTALCEETLRAHGQAPLRRLARLHPRPGGPALDAAEYADFLRRYGHEYCVAWLPAVDGTAEITAAAREAGCAVGFYPPRS